MYRYVCIMLIAAKILCRNEDVWSERNYGGPEKIAAATKQYGIYNLSDLIYVFAS